MVPPTTLLFVDTLSSERRGMGDESAENFSPNKQGRWEISLIPPHWWEGAVTLAAATRAD